MNVSGGMVLRQVEGVGLILRSILGAARYRQHIHCPRASVATPAAPGFDSSEAAKYGELTSHRDGTESVFIRNPFGNTVEFIKPASEETML